MKISLTKTNLRIGNNPKIDWVLVLGLSIVVGAIVVYGAVTLFVGVKSGESAAAPSADGSTAGITLKPSDITKYTDALVKRDADFETIRRTPYTKTADPSR